MRFVRLTFVAIAAVALITPVVLGAKFAGEPFSIGVGARPLALGGAVVAGPADASTVYWNPAGMSLLSGRQVVAMHSETFGSLLNHDFIAYVSSDSSGNGFINGYGFYVYYLGGGGIKITGPGPDDRPVVLSEETHADILLAGGIGGRLSDLLTWGVVLKVIYRDLATESGKGASVDAGLIYEFHPRLTLGLTVTDITTGFIRYSGQTFQTGSFTETIYPTVKPGLMYTRSFNDFTGRFVASADFRFDNRRYADQYWVGEASVDSHFGLEVSFQERYFGRVGFDAGNFTTGVGLDVGSAVFDFAFQSHLDLDESYRISAGYSW